MIDFSTGQPNGTHGSLNSLTWELDGIKISASNGSLYRWNIEDFCCNHLDKGLGVLSEGEQINPAEPELNGYEFIRLENTTGRPWDKLWFTSVNDNSSVVVYANIFPVGFNQYFVKADEGPFTFFKEGFININAAGSVSPYLWIFSDPKRRVGNYTLVWGVDLKKPETPEVPEPTSLLLLGTGLLYTVRRWRG